MNEIEKIAKEFIANEFNNKILRMISKDMTPENCSNIINYIIETKAWMDTTRRERYNTGSAILKNKDEIVNCVKIQLNNLSNDCDFGNWHKCLLDELVNYKMTYGMAQKLINMSIKYIYFLELGYECRLLKCGSISAFQEKFDVPIDSYILKWILYNSLFDDAILNNKDQLSVWTKISNEKIYRMLQDKAKDLIKAMFPTQPILIAESKIWNSIKELKVII